MAGQQLPVKRIHCSADRCGLNQDIVAVGILLQHGLDAFADHEVLELRHSALSREVFASGALKAAHFLKGKQPGIYNMADVVAEIQ